MQQNKQTNNHSLQNSETQTHVLRYTTNFKLFRVLVKCFNLPIYASSSVVGTCLLQARELGWELGCRLEGRWIAWV